MRNPTPGRPGPLSPAPRMLLAARTQRPGSQNYDSRDWAAMFAGRAPVRRVVTGWTKAVLS